jgi:hypothetical protein
LEEEVKTEKANSYRTPLVVTFAEAATLDHTELGAKAANLARLASVGFPVPPGFAVTTTAERHQREVSAKILEAAAALGAEQFAVRSSGTAEDLEGASFAGQYETLLDVRIDDLPAAVGRVFDSACASGVSAYRDARTELTGETASSMAVLVQVMVTADSAGVAFTANPVTGERGEIVITAVRGLGERLVSGDEWVVRGDGASCRRESEGAITAEQAVKIAELARRVEGHFGSPQDIEWAISGDELPEAMTPLFADWLLALIEGGSCPAWWQEHQRTPCRASTGTIPPSASSALRAGISMNVTIGARSWPSEKQPKRRAAPSSPTGPSFSFGSTRFWRWRSGTPRSASNRRGTSPWAGRCCATARCASVRSSPKTG